MACDSDDFPFSALRTMIMAESSPLPAQIRFRLGSFIKAREWA